MAEVALQNGGVMLVDDEDVARVRDIKWYGRRDGLTMYAVSWCGAGVHRLILGASKGELVDHRNGDGLDNRRSNLRLATKRQNSQNGKKIRGKVKLKGVTYRSDKDVYRARITVNGKTLHLGDFGTAEEAGGAYDRAAVLHFGEFASTNAEMEKSCRSC